MLYVILPLVLLCCLWIFCVHMDEKELSNRQTRVLLQKEIHEKSEPEQNKPDKGVLPIRDLYYRFRRSDEEEELEQNLEKKRKSEEHSHDHQEDHQQDPPTALRERRRPLRHPREEEEDEKGESHTQQPESSAAPDPVPEPSKAILVETGTPEEWRQDQDVVDILIVKKDGETQTTVLQEDKGVEARPDMRDEEAQNSPVREDQVTQIMPKTKDIGTGEWLALQKSIGVGNHIETEEKGLGEDLKAEDKAIQVHPEQEDKSIQEEPEKESKGVGSYPASFHDKSVQVNPDAEDKSVQEVREHLSIGVGTDKKEMRDQSLQILPSLQDKDIQKDISRISIGIQNFNIFGEDKSVQVEEERKSISLSSLPNINLSFFSDKEKIDLSKSLSRSLSPKHPQNLLDELETIKSEILLSPKSQSIEFEDSELQELSPKIILGKQKSFHVEDIPLEVSIYPSMNRSLVESEVIENSILEKSKSLSLKKSASHKEIEDISFEILDKSAKSVKKKPLEDLSFEIIEKASRKSSFSILSNEDEK